jgi:Oxidoreductase family, NAD-binding Rossmann fold/Domain of unknown function (DUF6531)
MTTSSLPTLGIGMVGYAFMGAAHSQAWRTAGRVFGLPLSPLMVALCGRDAAAAGRAAATLGWQSSVPGWEELVERPDIDVIDICTPGDTHAQIAWPNSGLRFNFKVCAGTPQTPTGCVESGWTNATWVPPEGVLRWSSTYHWWVQVHDNVSAGPWAGPLQLTTQVPQPEITAHLGGTPQGAPAPGLDPQVGNYGMAGTDAAVVTVGPDLTVVRTYNSLDPRHTNAFGEGWASRVDTELTEDDDGSGNVVVRLDTWVSLSARHLVGVGRSSVDVVSRAALDWSR